ncbi:hypothetical protein F170042I7_20430 [Blautia caecimuris]|uniref:hypothetical protein n=1 Tax=Blautia caecimuris TaxID=1796615 RepID=UPI0034C3546F
MKYKEKYRPGMVFRSEQEPWRDIIITYVSYFRDSESSYNFKRSSIISWQRENEIAFDKFVCMRKGYNYLPESNGRMDFSDKNTFPYPFFGEKTQKSMDDYIRKYNMKLCDTDESFVNVYSDTECEYTASLINK